MKKIIPIVIPAKNEASRIAKTIKSIFDMFAITNLIPKVVLVDDGSNDNTSVIASELGCQIVKLKDRGYSALGKPELADTHNAGFKFIKENFHYDTYDYLMVVGADTTFEKTYLQKILKIFKEEERLVMCSGTLDGFKTNKHHVRGSGRLIEKSFWIAYGETLPNHVHGWESHPIYCAKHKGFKTLSTDIARMQTSRPPMKSVDWKRYGIAMKENGSILPYVILRAVRAFIKINPYQSLRLVLGYFSKPESNYEPELMNFIKNYQKKRILNYLKGFRLENIN